MLDTALAVASLQPSLLDQSHLHNCGEMERGRGDGWGD